MVGRRPHRRLKPALMGNHQRCWLWGRHAVVEMLRSGRWLPVELRWVPAALAPELRQEVERLALMHGLTLIAARTEELDRVTGRQDHQGLAAQMPEFPYASLDDLLQEAAEFSAPFVLFLDRIQDPHNLGAILRSAEVLGAAGVVIPEDQQAGVSAQVVRSSAGAVHHLRLARVASLVDAARRFRSEGYCLAGATEKADLTADQVDLTGPLALIIGNEGAGPQPELLNCCSVHVRIPQVGQVGSLNAAVAASILCYEAARQRQVS